MVTIVSSLLLLAEAILNQIVGSWWKKYTARRHWMKSFDWRPLYSYLKVLMGSKMLTRFVDKFLLSSYKTTQVQQPQQKKSQRIIKAQELCFSGYLSAFLLPLWFKSLSILTFGGKSGRFCISCSIVFFYIFALFWRTPTRLNSFLLCTLYYLVSFFYFLLLFFRG